MPGVKKTSARLSKRGGDKSARERAGLAAARDWDAYLMQHSNLPGPRSNLELVQVAAELGDAAQFLRWLEIDAARAPANTPGEFLPVCGAVGFGRLVAEGAREHVGRLRAAASDARWRVREGAAMGLQKWGDRDMDALLDEMKEWSAGNFYEQRAVVAALGEPRLLKDRKQVARVLKLLDRITRQWAKARERGDDWLALKKTLGYGWSVAIVAAPEVGQRAFEKWMGVPSEDVRRVLRENLKKDRLRRMDAGWVEKCAARLAL